jgi:hypothetical protein
MRRDLIVKLLFLLLVVTSLLAYAKDKSITIEVVETTEEVFIGHNPPSANYSAKVILPDGAHAYLACLFPLDEGCGLIEPWTLPEKTAPADCHVSDYEGGYMLCKRKNLGAYRAKRKGDDLTIYGRKGEVRYHIATGPWQ